MIFQNKFSELSFCKHLNILDFCRYFIYKEHVEQTWT